MRFYSILIVLISVLIFSGCGTSPGVPVEFAGACTMENDKKNIEVGGFLDDKGGVFCSNTGGGPVRCGFKLRENPQGEKTISADIEVGSSANTVEKLERSYKREDIKIRDNQANVINLADKVKITGTLNTTEDAKVCYITVGKIEKQ